MSNHLLTFFFEGNISLLVQQLQQPPFKESDQNIYSLISALLSSETEQQTFEEFYSLFVNEKNWEACCACVGGALAVIWNNGHDFSLFTPWLEKAAKILEQSTHTPEIAKAFLLQQKGLAEMLGTGDLEQAEQTFFTQKLTAEKARSNSLQLIGAALHACCFTWSGNLPKGEMILLNSVPLLNAPDINPLCLMQYQMAWALNKVIQGDEIQAHKIIEQILEHPLFNQRSSILQLQAYSLQLDFQVIAGAFDDIEQTSESIKALAIPKQNNYFRCYFNFNLGKASLAQGRPSKAFGYVEEATRRAELCRSAAAIRMCALLYGQVLSELGHREQALKHLNQWHDRWMAADYHLIAALGRLEVTKLYQQQGKLEKARQNWHQAHDLLPPGEQMYQLYRPADFRHELEEKLFPPEPKVIKECVHPVKIKALGPFELEINGYKSKYPPVKLGALFVNRSKRLFKS